MLLAGKLRLFSRPPPPSGPVLRVMYSRQIVGQTVRGLLYAGLLGPHKLELLLVSSKLGVHSLRTWNLRRGFRLTLIKSGTGTGSVTSIPSRIDCGPGCNTQTATFPENDSVQVSTSVSPGTTVTWGGDCATHGTGSPCSTKLSTTICTTSPMF